VPGRLETARKIASPSIARSLQGKTAADKRRTINGCRPPTARNFFSPGGDRPSG
jgi:hypothetical protein